MVLRTCTTPKHLSYNMSESDSGHAFPSSGSIAAEILTPVKNVHYVMQLLGRIKNGDIQTIQYLNKSVLYGRRP